MKKIILSIILLIISAVANGQSNRLNNLMFENLSILKENEKISIAMDMKLNNLELGSNDMLILTPMFVSNKTNEKKKLASIVIIGKQRNKVLERKIALNNDPGIPDNVRSIVRHHNGLQQTFTYVDDVSVMEWMNDASLLIEARVKGCAGCEENPEELLLSNRIIREHYRPTYKLIYVVPEVEPVEVRAEKHSSSFNYMVAKHDLVRNFKNNAAEFDRVDRVINEVKNNKNLEITEFTVSGYASPEGNYNANRILSDRRAHSFADYLSNVHHISRNRFVVNGYGEDWEGLKEAVKKSSLPDKNEIIRIITNVDNPDARDAELQKLAGGKTYRTLVESYYPPLRRTDFTIAYHVRAFSVEEAREVIRSNPGLLSLNEMYLVAQSYPVNSAEFKEVFDIATRIFPNEPIALINASAADIEAGNYQVAIDRMSKMENDPRVLNNMGVAYARMGNNDKAKVYFEKAAHLNENDAIYNLSELQKVMEQ